MSTTQSNLKKLREVHHLSQLEISRRTGINQTRLSRWEAGGVASAADAALCLAKLVEECDAKAAIARCAEAQPEAVKEGA
jgi:transcriptional regulator with XRE-family HTH domain